MTRLTVFLLLATALAAGSLGYWAGRDGATQSLGARASPAAAPTGPVIYYRDPDRKPFYSATPKKTADGRDYVAVLASEDVSVEPKAASLAAVSGGVKTNPLLPQSHGFSRYLACAQEGLHGHGLHSRL